MFFCPLTRLWNCRFPSSSLSWSVLAARKGAEALLSPRLYKGISRARVSAADLLCLTSPSQQTASLRPLDRWSRRWRKFRFERWNHRDAFFCFRYQRADLYILQASKKIREKLVNEVKQTFIHQKTKKTKTKYLGGGFFFQKNVEVGLKETKTDGLCSRQC